MYDITKCKTIDSFKEYGKQLLISHSRLFHKAIVENQTTKFIINDKSYIDAYMSYIKKICFDYEMSDTEYIAYRYNPKLFSYSIYGTTELWSLLLKINNMVSVTEFNKKNIIIFTSDIFDIINEINIITDMHNKKNENDIEY